jgi:4-diphosphocytidyl-2C-methyl-D-erythritol kinase
VETLEPDLGAAYLLVTPRLPVSTPVVYAAWDELGGPKGDFGNDLEPAALHAVPSLRWWRDVMAAVTGERPRLAGSGGTWFIETTTDRLDELAALAAHVRAEVVYGWESALVLVARAIGPSWAEAASAGGAGGAGGAAGPRTGAVARPPGAGV